MPQAVKTKFGPPVISVDVEDWPQSSWDRSLPVTERAARNTHHLLDLLAEHKVRATMFVLGLFAEKFPEIVVRMHREGHEVGCHTYGHLEVFHQTREQFYEDTRRVWNVCEGRSASEIATEMAAHFDVKPDMVLNDVQTALSDFRRFGLFLDARGEATQGAREVNNEQ